jgi:PAS domain S-box-containing protein
MIKFGSMGSTVRGEPPNERVSSVEGMTEETLHSLAGAVLKAADYAQLGVSVLLVEERPMRRMYVNDTAVRILGQTREELLRTSVLLNYTDEEKAHLQDLDERRRNGEDLPPFLETVVQRPDGNIPIEVAYSKVELNGQLAIVSFMRDIRDRRKTEEALRKSEAMFRLLIEAAPDAVAVTRDKSVVYGNPAFLALLGYERLEDLKGIPSSELIHPDDLMRLRTGPRARARPAVVHAAPEELRLRTKAGDYVPAEASWIYIEYEGQPAALSFIHDLTERRKQQAQIIQTDRMATIGTLAAGVAHELNNPLAYVMLNLNLLSSELAGVLPPAVFDAVKSRLTTVQQGTERMASIVRDLRSLCRPDAPALHPVDVRAVLESAINMAMNELKGRARIVRDYALVPPVVADEARLGQVFLNLLVNAAHALPEGRPELNEVRISLLPLDADHVRVEISDTGHGIPKAMLGRIFEPFFTTKPAGVGMGLGLSISQSIIAGLRGELVVESHEGKGTTFRITVPVGRGAPKVERRSTPMPGAGLRAAAARVLIVDDEPALASALAAFLGLEHHVTVVGRAEQALALLSEGHRFDAIVCDVLMPQISGIDMYEQIERRFPAMTGRMIFITGASTMPRVADFLARVDNARLDKPIDVEQLKQTVNAVASQPHA